MWLAPSGAMMPVVLNVGLSAAVTVERLLARVTCSFPPFPFDGVQLKQCSGLRRNYIRGEARCKKKVGVHEDIPEEEKRAPVAEAPLES